MAHALCLGKAETATFTPKVGILEVSKPQTKTKSN